MANHFVDGISGNNANSGHTMDLAWLTVEYALESGALIADDIVWPRRNVNEIPLSDILTGNYVGTLAAPIRIIGCPRATVAIASSDWTNGSPSVNIDAGGMTREAHQCRYITAPDGRIYFITRVSGASTLIIDREYVGATVTNQAATISADEDYALFNAIDDSAWTIKKSDWNADAHTLARIDFNDTAFQVYHQRNYWIFKNLDFRDSDDATGIFFSYIAFTTFIGCMFKQHAILRVVFRNDYSRNFMQRCTIEGAGTAPTGGIGIQNTFAFLWLKDVAIYGHGSVGLNDNSAAGLVLENVNIGVEVANGSYDIALGRAGLNLAKDLKLGGTNGYVQLGQVYSKLYIENYQKILGNHRTYNWLGYIDKEAISATPAKKVSNNILKITQTITTAFSLSQIAYVPPILTYDIDDAPVGVSRTYRLWIFNNHPATLNLITAKDNIFLKGECVSGYDDTSEYVNSEIFSSQTSIVQAADANGWGYLEVTVVPVVLSKIRLSVYFNYYNATGNVYIDPKLRIM